MYIHIRIIILGVAVSLSRLIINHIFVLEMRHKDSSRDSSPCHNIVNLVLKELNKGYIYCYYCVIWFNKPPPSTNLHCCLKTRSSLATKTLKRKVFTLFVMWAISLESLVGLVGALLRQVWRGQHYHRWRFPLLLTNTMQPQLPCRSFQTTLASQLAVKHFCSGNYGKLCWVLGEICVRKSFLFILKLFTLACECFSWLKQT